MARQADTQELLPIERARIELDRLEQAQALLKAMDPVFKKLGWTIDEEWPEPFTFDASWDEERKRPSSFYTLEVKLRPVRTSATRPKRKAKRSKK